MIVVTAPTANIGQRVVFNLLAAGAPVRVIARDARRLSPALRGRVEIVEGSHGDPEVLRRALAGAEALFWLAPTSPAAPSLDALYSDFTRPACDALVDAGLRRVVVISALGRGSALAGRAGLVTASLAMDDLLAATGTPVRALALPSFMDNMKRQVALIRDQGLFQSPLTPTLKLPTCAARDSAAAAARLLLDDTWRGYEHVPLLGPEDLSDEDLAAIMSEVLGRPIRCRHLSWAEFEAQWQARGASPAYVRGMIEMMQAKDQGLDHQVARTPATSTPTRFRDWCETELKPALGL